MKIYILAHRGIQQAATLQAYQNALSLGYGIEADIRDESGMLVVAHDPQDPKSFALANLCESLRRHPDCPVALNIKSAGLQPLLTQMLKNYAIENYFTFDMAIPDLRANLRSGLTSFTRHSDIEQTPALYAESHGIWLDSFDADWLTPEILNSHAHNKKSLAIVSPELHNRPHLPFWHQLKTMLPNTKTYLCTDHPEAADHFFND